MPIRTRYLSELSSPAEDDTAVVTSPSAIRRRTSIYLTEPEARRLKHIAADEGKKVHDLFMEGIAYVLSQRPNVDPIGEKNRRLLVEVEAANLERVALTSKVEEIQAQLETALQGAGRWKKGIDQAASKHFWDGVMFKAADVLRGNGLMSVEAILASLPDSTKRAAKDGGRPISGPTLARQMSDRADARKMFVKVGKEFRLRDGGVDKV